MTTDHAADLGERASSRRVRLVLAVSIAMTLGLYFLPFGRVLARPFVLFSTLVHELGHGMAAILVGGRFEALLMWSDGSGVATWTALVGRLGHAAIAAGGLIGPAVGAAVCLAAGRRPQSAKLCLLVIGMALVLVDAVYVRTLFGAFFVGLVAIVFILIGVYARPWMAQLAVVFVGVQLALSVFSRGDYLFTAVATTSAGEMPSDTAQIAEALWLPFWFWGACCGLLSLGIVMAAFVWTAGRGGVDAPR